MSSQNQKLLIARNNEIVRKRLYKSKSHWTVATVGALALGATAFGGLQTTAHADAAPAATNQAAVQTQMPGVTATATPGTVEASPMYSQVTAPAQSTGTTPIVDYGAANVNVDPNQTQGNVAATTQPKQFQVSEGNSTILGPQTPIMVTSLTPKVNSANAQVAKLFSSDHNYIEDVGGTLDQQETSRVNVDINNPKSASDWLASNTKSQYSNISATASADSELLSMGRAGQLIADSLGGDINLGKPIDVSKLTGSQVVDLARAQMKNLSLTNSGNEALSNDVVMASHWVREGGGALVPGNPIDVSSMTPEQIQSQVDQMASMISVTASADKTIVSASNSADQVVNAAGGQISFAGLINTADDMTPEDVKSAVQSQIANLDATVSADSEVMSIIAADHVIISQAGGHLVKGAPIDVGNLSPRQIKQIEAQQSAMLSATTSADSALTSLAGSAQPWIVQFGGSVDSKGILNTADDMTVSEIQQIEETQMANISAVASADIILSHAVKVNKKAVKKVHGHMRPGSQIDATGMKPEELRSIVSHQSEMISATASADRELRHALKSVGSIISNAGGTISLRSMVNTADNMTTSDIAWMASGQGSTIAATVKADEEISQAIVKYHDGVTKLSGVMKSGTPIDTTGMDPERILNIVNKQSAMLSATASANNATWSAVQSARSAIEAINGSLTQKSMINTAYKTTVQDISDLFGDQSDVISATASGDIVISQAASKAAGPISDMSGFLTAGSSIDTTGMELNRISALVYRQSAMLSATASADSATHSAVVSATSGIEANGGKITQKSMINTADNMTVAQIQDAFGSQNDVISATASADLKVSGAASAAGKPISDMGGVMASGIEHIDTTGMKLASLISLVDQQSQMLSATASADFDTNSAVSEAQSNILAAGGKLTKTSMINTADNMTVSEVDSLEGSQANRISNLGSNDGLIKSAFDAALASMLGIGGEVVTGSDLDVTDMNLDEINSLAYEQVGKLSTAASATVALSKALQIAQSQVQNAGGSVAFGSTVDITSMSSSEVSDMLSQDVARLQNVGQADAMLMSTVAAVSAHIAANGGTLSKAPDLINVASLNPEQVMSLVASQTANLRAVAAGNQKIADVVNAGKSAVEAFGGQLVATAPSDVNSQSAASIADALSLQAANLSAVTSTTPILASDLADYEQKISAFGGEVTKGAILDVTGWTPAQVQSYVNSADHLLFATASADTAASQLVISATDGVKMVNGTIDRGSDVDTATTDVAGVSANVLSQSLHLSQVSAGDSMIASLVTSASVATQFVNGKVTIASPIQVGSMTSNEIASLVSQQAMKINTMVSANSMTTSAVQHESLAIESLGGTITQDPSAVDMTNMTSEEVESFTASQVSNIVNVGLGAGHLNSAYAANISAAAKPGEARDFTGKSTSETDSFVASQITALGRATDTDRVVDSYVGDFKQSQIDVSFKTQTVSTAEEIESVAQQNTVAQSSALSTAMQTGSAVVTFTRVQYVTHGLSVKYKGVNVSVNGMSTQRHVYINHGTIKPFKSVYTPYATNYKPMSDIGGLRNVHIAITPMSTGYNGFYSDGTKVKVYTEDGKLNPGFTGYTSFDTTYNGFESDGAKVNVYNKDGSLNHGFTGYAPLSTTFNAFESDGSKVKVYNDDGTLNPDFTGYTPFSTSYYAFESDGKKVNVYTKDGKLNPKFTGFAPISTTYETFESDGSKVPQGHRFTGIAPLSTRYFGYESNALDVPKGHNFTGFAPLSTTLRPYSTKYHFYQDVPEMTMTPSTPAQSATPITPTSSIPAQSMTPSTPAEKPVSQTPASQTPAKKVIKQAVTPAPVQAVAINPVVPQVMAQRMNAISMPATQVASPQLVSAPVMTVPRASQNVLPQTGNKETMALAMLGLMTLGLTIGLSVKNKKMEN